MKVAFVIANLGCGGAEKVLTLIANSLVGSADSIQIITFAKVDRPHFPVHRGIKIVSVDRFEVSKTLRQKLESNIIRISRLRRLLSDFDPDVVVSFMDRVNVVSCLASLKRSWRLIVSERSVPGHFPIGRFWGILRSLSYRRADCVVAQTKGVSEWLRKNTASGRIEIVGNPVELIASADSGRMEDSIHMPRKNIILYVGRFAWMKRLDIMVRAFYDLGSSREGWELWLVGDGPTKSEIETLVSKLKLSESVVFKGRLEELDSLYQEAAIFAMSSSLEGMPNALMEAMAWGIACISTDCPFGPRDVIENNVDGLLVANENVDEFSRGLQRLVTSSNLRERLGASARESCVRFEKSSILKRWHEIILD